MKRRIDTFGWYPTEEVRSKCTSCINRIEEGVMSCCELDENGFPTASSCFKFRHFESVEI